MVILPNSSVPQSTEFAGPNPVPVATSSCADSAGDLKPLDAMMSELVVDYSRSFWPMPPLQFCNFHRPCVHRQGNSNGFIIIRNL